MKVKNLAFRGFIPLAIIPSYAAFWKPLRSPSYMSFPFLKQRLQYFSDSRTPGSLSNGMKQLSQCVWGKGVLDTAIYKNPTTAHYSVRSTIATLGARPRARATMRRVFPLMRCMVVPTFTMTGMSSSCLFSIFFFRSFQSRGLSKSLLPISTDSATVSKSPTSIWRASVFSRLASMSSVSVSIFRLGARS